MRIPAWRCPSSGSMMLCGGRFYLRTTDPKYAVAAFTVFNVVLSAVYLFVPGTWGDWYTACRYWVTLTGLVAIGELYRARKGADQLKDAIAKEALRQRKHYYRYCLNIAKTAVTEV